jgi:myosin-heavy-chain kinase
MDPHCPFYRFGCKIKLANEDHALAHSRDTVSYHLGLVVQAFDQETERNKLLANKLEVLQKWVKEHDDKLKAIASDKSAHDKPNGAEHRDKQPISPRPEEPIRDRDEAPTPRSSERPLLERIPSVSKMGMGMDKELVRSRRTTSKRLIMDEQQELKSTMEAELAKPPLANTPSTPNVAGTWGTPGAPGNPGTPSPPNTPGSTDSKRASRRSGASFSSLLDEELPEGFERGIVWEYDPATDEWARGVIVVKLEKGAFAEGALRTAHLVDVIGTVVPCETTAEASILGDKTLKSSVPLEVGKMGNQYVAKISKQPVPSERYFEDVKMQVLCKELGNKFNQQGAPKRVEFLMAWVLQVTRNNESVIYGLEPFIEGEFKKMNSNFGVVLTDRNTPQAFSHFTYEHSSHNLLVIDIQGVNDQYTDPQIHTKDGKGYGLGNMGHRGIERFLKTHVCNPICLQLNLPLLNVDPVSLRRRHLRGTMKAPSLDADLSHLPKLPSLDVPDPYSSEKGEFQCVHTLTGNEDRVISLCLDSKRNYLFSATADGTVKVWNSTNWTAITTFRAHRKSIESMCINDKHLFTASADHALKVWELGDFSLVERMRDHTGEVNCVVVSGDALYSASFDKTIKVWSTSTFKCNHSLEGHSKSVKCLFVAGGVLISGSNDGTIRVWNLTKMTCIFSVEAHDGWVKTLAVHNHSLYSGAFDYKIKEWDLRNFMATKTFGEHTDNITCLCATQKYLVSASEDKTVKVWAYGEEKAVATLKGHRAGVQSVVADGKHIISASDDYNIKVWKWVKS